MKSKKSPVLVSLAFCTVAAMAPLLVQAASVKPQHSMQEVRQNAFGGKKLVFNEFRFDNKKQVSDELRFFEQAKKQKKSKKEKKERIDRIVLVPPTHVHTRGCGHDTPSQDVPVPGTLALLALGLAGLGMARRRSGEQSRH